MSNAGRFMESIPRERGMRPAARPHGPETPKGAEGAPATIAVIDREPFMANSLRETIIGAQVLWVHPGRGEDLHELVADVRLLRLGSGEAGALTWPALCEHAALVFWTEDPTAPEVLAARALGIVRIIPAIHLSDWLAIALGALVSEAQALRMLRIANERMPPVPESSVGARCGRRLRLSAAETQFRETYLRGLLAETQSRRRAAELAGVPYRTFYDMLKKLNLEDAPAGGER